MHHLEPVRAVAHFAVAEQAHAGRELIGLAPVEMEEAQHQRRARIVADRDAQLRPIAETALDRFDDADDLRAFADAKLADRRHVRAIFVAQRQMEPEILHALESEPRERFGERGTDAGQRRNRQRAGIGGGALCDVLRSGCGIVACKRSGARGARSPIAERAQSSTSTASISTSAPRGSADTPIVERAGYGSLQYSAMTALTAAKFLRSVR